MTSNLAAQNAAPEYLNAAAISARLFNIMRAQSTGNECIYLLLDRYSEYPLKDAISALPDADSICLPLLDRIFKDNTALSPLLVRLQYQQAEHMQVLEQSISMALEQASQPSSLRNVCAWLMSDVEPTRLQNSLKVRLQAQWPENQSIYLRYFDPRVMPRLLDILPAHLQAELFGAIQQWCQLGRDGQWLKFSPPGGLPTTSISGITPRPAQTLAIDRIALINLTAAELKRNGLLVPHSLDSVIDDALVAAQKLGITNDDDTVAYAWRAIAYQSVFTQKASLPELVQQAHNSGLPLDALLNERLQLTQPASQTTTH
jgi:Domain of unknown function (DUF4123)